uniref:Thiol:disulfide interchange protein n=1 Tax=Nitophyllum punctatum TaxID=158729 RepID=A0A4D6WUV7_9FLOR|nr:Thiol:disulfide interchange protein [Nitophyllum punctatum]
MFIDIFYNNFEIFTYGIEQNIAYLLSLNIKFFSPTILILLLLSGILTSMNPCLISILPISMSYINSRKLVGASKILFVIGLFTSISLVIIFIRFLSLQYFLYFINIPLISFCVLLILSLNLLQILDISALFSWMQINSSYNIDLKIESYLIGFFIGLSSLPCSTSIMFIINFWLSRSFDLFVSIIYFFCYLLGCLCPFIIIFNIEFNSSQVYFISYIWNLIVPISGAFILMISLLSLMEKIFI